MTVKFTMLGVRFLDVDFMRINFAVASSYCICYALLLHSQIELRFMTS